MTKSNVITTFDFETITDNFNLDRIGLYSVNYQEIFLDYDSFLNFIVKKKIEHLYAFYGGGFDFLLILEYFRKNLNFKLVDILEINGIILYLKINYFGYEFILQDAYFLVLTSLNDFAIAMLGHGKMNIDRKHLENYTEQVKNEYVMSDCILLHDSLIEFRNVLGFLDITISRMALLNFMNNFNRHSIELKKSKYPKDFINNIQSWYYGGHVDVFKRYGENLFYYDINSCYGYAMKELGAIYSFVCYTDKFKDTETLKGLYSVIVGTDLNIPIIPIRLKEKNYEKIYFLNTRKPVCCTSIDIQLLEQLNIKYKVLNGFMFKYDPEFFSDYIEYWYKQRQENPKLNFIAKRMINHLYGKFGQKIKRLTTVVSDKLDESQYYDIDLKIGRKEITRINWFNHPEISTWVTSGARYYHSTLLNQYQNNLYYGDTDSLILNCKMNDVQIGKDIGQVKLEHTLIERGYFLGSKFYGFFNDKIPLSYNNNDEAIYKKIVLKGFEQTNFTETQFISAIKKNDFSFEYTKKSIQGFKRSLISFDKYIQYIEAKKHISEIELKRKLNTNLIDTTPYFLNNNNKLT